MNNEGYGFIEFQISNSTSSTVFRQPLIETVVEPFQPLDRCVVLYSARPNYSIYVHMYVYIYIYIHSQTSGRTHDVKMPSLHTKILDFRGFDSSRIIVLRGGISTPTGNFLGNFESTNLSRDNLRREIGRTGFCEKNKYPPEQKTLGKTGFQSAKSGPGELLLPLDCMAKARVKGLCFHRCQ